MNGSASPMRKAIRITVFFTMVGPPLGSIVFWTPFFLFAVFTTIAGIRPEGMPNELAAPLWIVVFAIVGMSYGYLFGTIPAFVVGFLVGVLQIYRGANYLGVLVIGLGIGAGYAPVSQIFFSELVLSPWVWALICSATAVLCWRAFKFWCGVDASMVREKVT